MSAPALGNDGHLLMCRERGARVENMTDLAHHQFVVAGTRGGLTFINHRRTVADNKYTRDAALQAVVSVGDKHAIGRALAAKLADQSDEREGDTFLLYLDANNLYGGTMLGKVPVGDFAWVENGSLSTVDAIMALDPDGELGYTIQCDWRFPLELHDVLNDYTPAPELMPVTDAMLSPWQTALKAGSGRGRTDLPKLVPSLLDKRAYICHFRNFQAYVRLGMVPTNISRVLRFRQEAVFAPWVQTCTERRKEASAAGNEFGVSFWKLMINAVYGKTMEDVTRYRDITVLATDKRTERLVRDPRYRGFTIFGPTLAALERVPKRVVLNKPTAQGAAILDNSKLVLLDFWYGQMQRRYGHGRVKLLMTDTDSIVVQVTTGDVYRDMAEQLEQYDTANYPRSHPLYSSERDKTPLLMKDELGGIPMTEFVALQPKVYAYTAMGEQGAGQQKAKGTSKAVTKGLTIDTYRSVLDACNRTVAEHVAGLPSSFEEVRRPMHALRSAGHEMFLVEQDKIALGGFDNKRWIGQDGIAMRAFGHWRNVGYVAEEGRGEVE